MFPRKAAKEGTGERRSPNKHFEDVTISGVGFFGIQPGLEKKIGATLLPGRQCSRQFLFHSNHLITTASAWHAKS
jgi:hypothetical protein